MGHSARENGDYTFLLHILKSLKSTGKGAVILPHGVLFRGNAEARIRENLIRQGYIKGIIGLPANLFFGTGIPACIIVINKEQAQGNTGIFMIDASKGFIKDGNKNRLREQDIHKIVDVFTKQLEVERYSRKVGLDEIIKNEYNLNIPRYIDASEPEDLHDLTAHLQGGIPERDIEALDAYWSVFPSMRETLFTAVRPGYSKALIEANKVKATLIAFPEFQAFAGKVNAIFDTWYQQAALKGIQPGDQPKALIHTLSEALLAAYTQTALLNQYDVYQILMDYWHETLQDDVYLLSQEGWAEGRVLRELVAEKGEKLKETPDLVINKTKYKADLIPPALMVARFFADAQQQLDALQAAADNATQALESFLEENSGEDGLLADALNDKEKVTKASVTARLKVATDNDEKSALKQAKTLFDAEADSKKAVKEAQDALDRWVFQRYSTLTDDEIKTLIVEDKWQATLSAQVQAEVERIIQQLANRVKELEERYAEPLSVITQSVATLSEKVADHLKAMGLEV